MKKILIVFAVFALFACNSRNNTNKNNTEDERLQIQAGTNSTVIDPLASNSENEAIYEGIIPCADCPGIKYNLKLRETHNGRDSVYHLAMTYLEAENGKDKTYDSERRWTIVDHNMDNQKVKLYRLTPISEDKNDRPMELLIKGDSITFVDNDRRLIQSDLNYTLVRIK